MAPVVAKAAAASSLIKSVEPKTQRIIGYSILGIVALGIWNIRSRFNKIGEVINDARTWIAEKLQLVDSEKDKIIKAFATDAAWSAPYWTDQVKTSASSSSRYQLFMGKQWTTEANKKAAANKAEALAKSIYNGLDGWNDFSQVLGALKQCRSRVDYSMVSNIYYLLYKKDLYNELRSELTINQMIEVVGWCKTTPYKLEYKK